MKTAARVFIIISMVGMFYLIVPLVVGIIALKKLDTVTSRSDLTGIAICVLIFNSLVAGILMLCMTDDDLKKQ